MIGTNFILRKTMTRRARTRTKLSILLVLIGMATVAYLVFWHRSSVPNRPLTGGTSNSQDTEQYCNDLEQYCLSYPKTWSLKEQDQQAQDHKGKTTNTRVVRIIAQSGMELTIIPIFGGGPGGGKCFAERIQYNPDSECFIETYVSMRGLTKGSFCEENKTPYIIHKEIHTPSKPLPRYQLRLGNPREHDTFSTPITLGKEFLSNGYDYDNTITHCNRMGDNQPQFGALRFDNNVEGSSQDFFRDPNTLEAESILESFHFL